MIGWMLSPINEDHHGDSLNSHFNVYKFCPFVQYYNMISWMLSAVTPNEDHHGDSVMSKQTPMCLSELWNVLLKSSYPNNNSCTTIIIYWYQK